MFQWISHLSTAYWLSVDCLPVNVPPACPLQEEDRDETESLADGYASVASGFASSLPSGIETPSEIDLRKTSEGPKQLYTVLEQQKASVGAGALMGSDHTYVVPGAGGSKEKMSIAAQASLLGKGASVARRGTQRKALGQRRQ